jgi:choline-sulfatase
MPQIDSLWLDRGDPWAGHRTPDGRLGTVAVGRPSVMEEPDHFDNFVARESVRFLENFADRDGPFLLVSSFLKPHDPFMPAKRFAEMFDSEQMQLPATWGKVDLSRRPRKRMAYYYGNLAQMDDCAGQVLRALTRLGLERNTIVVYTSDHGEMLGDLGLWNKFQFYEGSCGVPLFFRMPGGAPGLCKTPVNLVSLTATIAELCNVPVTAPKARPLDGRSFADLVRKPDATTDHGPVFAEYNVGESSAKYMIREGSYKYTFWANDIDELYDLSSDPEEMHNLAAEPAHRPTVERLKAALFAWHLPPEIGMKASNSDQTKW